jgi:DNA polymerase elongation subunit (family B)
VPNQYFGVFRNGDIKTRGIETRRHDTPAFIKDTQMQILEILAKAPNVKGLKDRLPEAQQLVEDKQTKLKSRRIPPEQLIVHQTVSRELNEFRSSSPTAIALKQLDLFGKTLRPGQPVRFIYTSGIPRAIAWDLPATFNPDRVNIPRYSKLLERAVNTVLEPIMERMEGNQTGQLRLDL